MPEAATKVAVETVIGYLKKKLPDPVGDQIDVVLKGGGLGDMAKGLGDLFGKK